LSLDESWFYLSTDHERIWLTPEQPVPDRERHMAQSPKLMSTVAWNPNGSMLLRRSQRDLNLTLGIICTQQKYSKESKSGGKGRELAALEK
jgi:hypothetical protein